MSGDSKKKVPWTCPDCQTKYQIYEDLALDTCPACRKKKADSITAELNAKESIVPISQGNRLSGDDRAFLAALAYRILRLWTVIVFLPIALGSLLFPLIGVPLLLWLIFIYIFLDWSEPDSSRF